jgi:hypothetical protein
MLPVFSHHPVSLRCEYFFPLCRKITSYYRGVQGGDKNPILSPQFSVSSATKLQLFIIFPIGHESSRASPIRPPQYFDA